MVGDNYLWDYRPAKAIGVDARLIETSYMKKDKRLKIIKKISGVLDWI